MRGEEGLRLHYTSEALRLTRESGDARTELAVLAQLTVVQVACGRLADAFALAEEVLAHPEDQDLRPSFWQSPRGPARNSRALAFAYLGRPGDGRREILENIELARGQGDHRSLGGAFINATEIAWLVGDAASTTSYARLRIELNEKTGGHVGRTPLVSLGAAHVLRREWPEAIDFLEQALAVDRQRARRGDSDTLAHLALAQLGSGDVPKARETALEAVALTSKQGTKLHEPYARIVLARVLMQSDGASARSAIEAELHRAEALIDEMGARALAPLVLEERARLARLLGDEPGCERELREAHRLFAELGATGHAERLAQEL